MKWLRKVWDWWLGRPGKSRPLRPVTSVGYMTFFRRADGVWYPLQWHRNIPEAQAYLDRVCLPRERKMILVWGPRLQRGLPQEWNDD